MKGIPGGTVSKIVRIVKALIASYIAMGILLLILTLVLYKFKISNSQIYIGVVITYLLSNFFGGFVIGKIANKRKFIWGAVLGICFFIVLAIISFITTQNFFEGGSNAIIALVASVVGGMIGGMVS